MSRRDAPRGGAATVLALAAAYALVFTTLSFVKYRHYLYDGFDLAIFAQALHGVLHGGWFSSLRGMDWLGDHTSVLLLALLPFYSLAPRPETLLVAQSAALALGAFPVYSLARRALGEQRLALACVLAYLLFPALGWLNLDEFHPEALAVPLLLAALDALLAGRRLTALMWSAVALLAREDVGLVVLGMALLALARRRAGDRALAAGLAVLALLSLAFTFVVLRPLLGAGHSELSRLYPDWGRSPTEIAGTLLRHPLDALRGLAATPGDPVDTALKRAWFARMLAPVLFLPLLSPGVLLIAAPIVLEHFLARGAEQHSVFFHYTALVIPFVVVAAVLGLARLLALARRLGGEGAERRVAAVAAPALLIGALAGGFSFGPLRALARPLPGQPEAVWPGPADRALTAIRDSLVRRLPEHGTVVAGFEFQPRLAARDSLQSLHHVLSGHWTISDKPFPLLTGVTAVIADFDPPRTLESVDSGSAARLRELVEVNGLRLAAEAGNLMLWLPGGGAAADSVDPWLLGGPPPAHPARLVYDGTLELLGDDLARPAVAPGGLLRVPTVWRRLGPTARQYVLLVALLDDRGRPVAQGEGLLGTMASPVPLWPPGVPVRTSPSLVVPAGVRPGPYTCAIRVGAWDGRTLALSRLNDPARAADRMLVRLGPVDVTPPGR